MEAAGSARVGQADIQLVDRSKPLTFYFEGKPVRAYEGDTIASALYAAGNRIYARSFKYHRPRGLLCVSGRCPNCMMNVDGKPNVRVCVEPARQGARVRHQNAWPSLNNDLFSAIERLGAFMPVGFYYKTFINFPWKWNTIKGAIRRVTGLGSIDEELARCKAEELQGPRHGDTADAFAREYLHADVAVVGGGPAGLVAAREASKLGASVVLVDNQATLGGHLRCSDEVVNLGDEKWEGEITGLGEKAAARKLAQAVLMDGRIKVLTDSTAFGLYEGNLLGVLQGSKTVKIRAEQVIVATGATQGLVPFENNDIPGIFLASGAERLVSLYGVKPGERAVIVAEDESGIRLAKTLLGAGVTIAAFADSRPQSAATDGRLEFMKKAGTIILPGHTIKKALGRKRVQGAILTAVDKVGLPASGSEKQVACDVLCLATSPEADASLLYQAGCKVTYNPEIGDYDTETKGGVYACGDVTGLHDLRITLLQARVAGMSAALKLRTAAPLSQPMELENYLDSLAKLQLSYRAKAAGGPHESIPPVASLGKEHPGKSFLCVCEDVVQTDVVDAIGEGFDDMETLKRYTTLSMGPCQGKTCLAASIRVCARETGRSIAETGRTVARPPLQPVPLGALAGFQLHPTKLTPLHYKHLGLKAQMMDMGEWKRPYIYTSVEEEYKAVREAVGVIDVGTLGRLVVQGKDAPALLDFIYTNVFSKLQPGKSRYGVICDETGVILDDGTVTRLSEDRYFITTTTGNIDFVEQWLEWWATTMRLEAEVTNLTSGLAGVNVAGPKARELLSKLTNIPLSNEAFPYMNGAEGLVAGVPAILLRIGFVGETGWEIHFPAEFGEYLWDTVMRAGKDLGVKPFGVEAQRVLRLDKKHVIVGQDTDALSTPYEADMPWTVKLEKEDWVGKAALRAAKDKPSPRSLVGFVIDDSVTAHDSDSVYSQNGATLVGFVTSSRFSPSAGKCVGLALVTSGLAKEGNAIKVKADGRLRDAKITLKPFYDPEGKRLKS
jgi:sarcosine oxidase, subunit alpha